MERPQLRGIPEYQAKYRPTSPWISWAVMAAVLVAVVAQPVGELVAFGASGAARIGSPAPDFTLRLLDGKTVTLSSLKGKPVVVNFWHSG